MRKWGLPFTTAFQYLNLMTWSTCYLNLVIIFSVDSKWQVFKVGLLIFQLFYEMKLKNSKFKFWSQWTMTKFKAQALHIIRIKYCSTGGRGNLPSLIPALWNLGILLHKQGTLAKHFGPECISTIQKVSLSSRIQKETLHTDYVIIFKYVWSFGLAKGQTKSKWFYQSDVSSKKRTNEFNFTSMRLVFFCFLEEIDDTQKIFRNQLTFNKYLKSLFSTWWNKVGQKMLLHY